MRHFDPSSSGDPGVLERSQELARLIEEDIQAEVVRVELEDDSGMGMNFDLATAGTVVAMVTSMFFSGPIVPSLLAILRKKPGSRITIETPTRTVTISSSSPLSEDEVRGLLAALAT